ncbi:LVIVD repeat-containing protein [Paraburkholderia elongata]|uniref:Uncharacterized protein n=1 Tax=Paraburkholderia elongata TaxID=2675747 RepID=A0A972NWC3_9BURK|nr:hypothetical protein [Paraburkholderia elongata]NPT61038.1 hypothetical protein [Paraburkholderia elongata]
MLEHQEDGEKFIWMSDAREPSNLATYPQPREIDYKSNPGHFGPHNLHENRPGSFVSSDLMFVTYQHAVVRPLDVSEPYRPAEVAAFVQSQPSRLMDQ